MFKLDERLKNDTSEIIDLELCKLLLANNKDFLWLILVPKEENLIELTDLDFDKQIQLLKEVNAVSHLLKSEFKADKINIATLGNVVSQLHVHVIARFKNDKAFPKPIWGIEGEKYEESEAQKLIEIIRKKCQ